MRQARIGPFRLDVPETHRERVRGLLGRGRIAPDTGLWLRPCRSIHTVGMRFAIDAVVLDGRDRVVAVRTLTPGRLLWPRMRARSVVEVVAGRGPALSRAFAARTTPDGRRTGRPGRS
jgi:uncharacterized protein